MVCAGLELRVDFKRDLGQLLLRLFRPGFGSPYRLFESL
jgi:hypothetical protein